MAQEYRIRADNRIADLVFNGKLVATGVNNNPDADQSTKFELYRTNNENPPLYVFVAETTNKSGHTIRDAYIFEQLDDLKFHIIGNKTALDGWVKNFFDEIGVEIIERI